MSGDNDWIRRAQQLQLPAVLPVATLPDRNADLFSWKSIVREDPLLTIHLFRYANKMLASHDVSVRTLDHAVNLLGSDRLVSLCHRIERIEERSASSKGLLRAIGDSLLAASLMRQWFEIRQIPWTETDYWMTLFYDLVIWVAWILEPQKMEALEQKVSQGGNRERLLSELLGMPVRECNVQLCRYFQLPVLVTQEDDTTPVDQRIQPYKQSALKFFLPFSHDLSFSVRQSWDSESLDALCRTGEVALGLTEFRPMLKQWVAHAAREFQLPYAALAARRLLAQQPDVSHGTASSGGFTATDLAAASRIAQRPPSATAEPEMGTWPEAKALAKRSSPEKNNAKKESKHPNHRRSLVDLNLQREIRRQFRNQKSWHSPVEIQESALYGLRKGLCLSRIVVLEERQGFWQVFDHEGCQSHPLLRSLKLPIHSSDILTEFSKKVTALWVNDQNRPKASKMLPPPLLAATDDISFFLRSFAINNEVTMLLYADAFEQSEPLNAADYQLFREYCADWNSALNKMRDTL